MKKKLEAELISIAHRILKLKNRDDLDQLQAETLNLYQKLSVLKFVEDNFSDVKPTIGYAMAEQKLEDIYHVAETVEEPETPAQETDTPADEAPVEQVSQEEKTQEEVSEKETEKPADDKETEKVEEPTEQEETEQPVEEPAETEEASAAETESTEEDTADPVLNDENASGEGIDTDSDGKPNAAEPEKQEEQKQEETPAKDVEPAKIIIEEEVKIHEPEQQPVSPEPELPEVKGLPEGEGQDKENGTGEGIDIPSGAPAVSEEETKTTKDTTGIDAAFNQKAPEKRDVVFEDFSGYAVEPEFIKKGEPTGQSPETAVPSFDDWMSWEPQKEEPKFELPKEEIKPETANPLDDWMNWEPTKSVDIAVHAEPTIETPSVPHLEHKTTESVSDWQNWQPSKPIYEDAEPQGQAKQPEPVAATPPSPTPPPVPAEAPKPVAAPKPNDGFVRALSLGLNDRIAFEKNLFGGSGEDLNRVVSQINTLNTFAEAQDFINDLVKPDYNNWNGKEEYETRFMELVEKKFS